MKKLILSFITLFLVCTVAYGDECEKAITNLKLHAAAYLDEYSKCSGTTKKICQGIVITKYAAIINVDQAVLAKKCIVGSE